MNNSRYSRNITVIGRAGQQKLAGASVMVVGCGALGGQVAMLLAGAGVGRVGIADFDTVDITNLQRQLFFSERDAGNPKSSLIASRMRSLNSEITVEEYPELITRSNGEEILCGYDFIVDATDNPSTKYFIDEMAVLLGKPCCIGGVAGWRGQVALLPPGVASVRYSDIFPAPEDDPSVLPCEVEGVMGMTASAIASIQASETVKWLIGENTTPLLTVIDLEEPSFSVIRL